jgi:hypothetical protein
MAATWLFLSHQGPGYSRNAISKSAVMSSLRDSMRRVVPGRRAAALLPAGKFLPGMERDRSRPQDGSDSIDTAETRLLPLDAEGAGQVREPNQAA